MKHDYYQALLETAHEYDKSLDDSLQSDLMRAELENYTTNVWVNDVMFNAGMKSLEEDGVFEDEIPDDPDHDYELGMQHIAEDMYTEGGDN